MRDFLGLETITGKIERKLKEDLDRCGLMYRTFSRVKTTESIQKKIETKNYRKNGQKITDLIGLRVTLYFRDDVDLVYKILRDKSNFDHESTDSYTINEFKPIRCNLTFNLDPEFFKEVNTILENHIDIVDTKYEIQIRTVLSEGWHEVEHDLRYKRKEDWIGHDDLSRNLNGIFATLETSDFSMLQMFESLAYRHYKDSNIEPLIKTKFRLRLKDEFLNQDLKTLLHDDKELRKKIFRIDRCKFLLQIQKNKIPIPLTINNLIFLINYFEVKDPRIREYENDFIKGEFDMMES